MDFLAFELVAQQLLKKMSIPTPETALVTISKDTLNKSIIIKNRRMEEGITVFGSKEIKNVKLVDDFSTLHSKHDFNRMVNPDDIVKIAIFDHWVKNNDRGRNLYPGHNYNLLLKAENKQEKLIAFDHAFIFGNDREIGNFFENIPVSNQDKLASTSFYRSIIKHIAQKEFVEIVDNFITLLYDDYSEIISETVEQLPSEWKISKNLDQDINKLLRSKKRIDSIRELIIQTKS